MNQLLLMPNYLHEHSQHQEPRGRFSLTLIVGLPLGVLGTISEQAGLFCLT